MARALTVSTNPAIDRVALVPGMAAGGVLRAERALETPGGKGAHVALIARAIGADVRLVTTCGGHSGILFARLLEEAGVPATLVPVAACTRGTYTIVDPGRDGVIEVHEPSGQLEPGEVDALIGSSTQELRDCRAVVITGSRPPGVAPDLHARLVTAGRRQGAFTVLDSSDGESLARGLEAEPDLVTPNAYEAGALLGLELADDAQQSAVASVARRLVGRGARAAWVSMGARGSLFADREAVWRFDAPDAVVVNTVGCGDALVGGFVAGLLRGLDMLPAVALGVAAAADKLTRLHPGRVDAAAVAAIAPTITPERVA